MEIMTRVLWVYWRRKKEATKSHAVKEIDARPVRIGTFLLACGRWVPDQWDVDEIVEGHVKGSCWKCSAAVRRDLGKYKVHDSTREEVSASERK